MLGDGDADDKNQSKLLQQITASLQNPIHDAIGKVKLPQKNADKSTVEVPFQITAKA